jgi:2,4-dienoyl-CoA reductase-like NADH-dependent reductase (Old Yellow Enzyme family)/enoyl-CoA hydratase/carnithine racemase
MGGAGMVVAEMTCPAPDARITPGCPGLWNDGTARRLEAHRRLRACQSDAKIAMQLGTRRRQGLDARAVGRRGPAAGIGQLAAAFGFAAAVPRWRQRLVARHDARRHGPRARRLRAQHALAAEAGFDWLELHCAHGYLLSSFISPLTNQRTDDYGGSLENRLRYPLEVFRAMRAAWPADLPMSVRISAHDWVEGGITPDDAVEIARAFKAAGADLIDCSSGQVSKKQKPVYGRMYQTPFADRIRNEAGIATMAVGAISEADHVNSIIAAGRADLCAIARPHLANPAWTLQEAAKIGYHDMAGRSSTCPARRNSNATWSASAPRSRRQRMNASTERVDPALAAGNREQLAGYRAEHFLWQVEGGRGDRHAEPPRAQEPAHLRVVRRTARPVRAAEVRDRRHAVVVAGAGDNFCSGGDVHEIIGPLVRLKAPELLMFTRMTGDLVKAMRACPQPIVAAIDGVCAGAGAIMAMASDLRLGTARSKTAFLFNRVGLAGCDMGACAMLPRIVGQGRASELLYTGRSLGGEEGERWGFFNRLCAPEACWARRRRWQPPGGGPDLRQRHHQDHAAPGMGHDARAGDRSGSAGAGAVHADRGLHPRLRGLRGQTEAALRGELNARAEAPGLALLRGAARHPRLRARRLGGRTSPTCTAPTSTAPAARWCRNSARAAGCAMPSAAPTASRR